MSAQPPARPPDTGMMADSPVQFPADGPLPSRFPPDRPGQKEAAEPDYFIFRTPERSLEQIAAIQEAMPAGSFTTPPADPEPLAHTGALLTAGRPCRLLALGDSIVNDTMRSAWVARLQQRHPAASIHATVYVRGGGGCQHYREVERIQRYVVPRAPDCVYIGGISQRSLDDIDAVVQQLRAALPRVEILLATGTFGTTDPRDATALAQAPFSGTGEYGRALRSLAASAGCAYLDMTGPWAEYIVSSGLHPHLFYRDKVHANEFGEQILGRIMLAFWEASVPGA